MHTHLHTQSCALALQFLPGTMLFLGLEKYQHQVHFDYPAQNFLLKG